MPPAAASLANLAAPSFVPCCKEQPEQANDKRNRSPVHLGKENEREVMVAILFGCSDMDSIPLQDKQAIPDKRYLFSDDCSMRPGKLREEQFRC
jgi:hypothetical protein